MTHNLVREGKIKKINKNRANCVAQYIINA